MASLRGARRATKQSRAAGAVRVALDCFASLAMTNKKTAAEVEPRRLWKIDHRDEGEASVLGRPGSDLLFQVLRLSTIGAEEFNGRVRDGIGVRLLANTNKAAKNRAQR